MKMKNKKSLTIGLLSATLIMSGAIIPSGNVFAAQDSTEAVSVDTVTPWANRVVANVEDIVNIRLEADINSEVVGKFHKGDAADILERGTEWTKISSGTVQGYINNQFLAFDSEAEQLANVVGTRVITVNSDGLRMRETADIESDILKLVGTGEQFTVTDETVTGWVGVQYDGNKNGYVSTNFVTVDLKLGEAISIEEERAAIKAAAEKEAAEAAKKEAAKKAAEAAKKETTEKRSSKSQKSSSKLEETAVKASGNLALLAAVIEMEAGGESYAGKLAVGSVIMNRVQSSSFPNSINGVIYQSGQFPGAHNGTLSRIISRGAGNESYKAAREALGGASNIGNLLYFGNGNSGLKIGNHYFH